MNLFNSLTRRSAIALTLACASVLPVQAQVANASTYPTKPVKIMVGYAAGGATDVVARLVAARLTERTGQTFIVENRSGANSNVAAQAVVHSPPDGYTLYVFTIANTINPSLYDRLGIDAQKDFTPIGLIAKFPNILVVNTALPIQNISDYLRFAKTSPNGVTFASSGPGSSIHLSGELFKLATKANMLHVAYRGSAPALSDLLGGQVQSMFDNISSALPYVQSGKLRAVAITSATRSPLLPDVPTVAESGLPGFDVQSWSGLAAPAGTPKAVIDRLNVELNKILSTPDMRKRLLDLGATPVPGKPDEFHTFIAAETKRWKEVVTASGAKAE